MTIDEAIARISGLIDIEKPRLGERDFVALKLGIEALKRIKRARELNNIWARPIIPGETKE